MGAAFLFEKACREKGIKFVNPLSRATDGPRDISTARVSRPLITFHLFPRLKEDIRVRIWAFAIQALPPRTVLMQPHECDRPQLPFTCFEALLEFIKHYKIHYGTQANRMEDFSICINYSKDTLYINRRFVRRPKNHRITALDEGAAPYPTWLAPVKHLALNLKDVKGITAQVASDTRQLGVFDIIWKNCPELFRLYIVVDTMKEVREIDGQHVQ